MTLSSIARSAQNTKAASLTHLVICWLDTSINDEELDMLIREAKKLASIPGVEDLSAGKSIKSDRDIVDDSFTFGISMKFKNVEEMNAYLKHDRHVNYVKNILKPRTLRITVYDFEN